jgi:CheY-like chemotaxis protein
VDENEYQTLEESYQLVITDNVLVNHAMHLWWVGVESESPDAGGIILYEPYARESLFNRVVEYISIEAEPTEGVNLNYAETVDEFSDSNAQQLPHNRQGDMTQSNNLLVVEDNLINQVVIQKTLEKMGYEVSVANNGEEGVALFQSNTFQGVIMDVQMPVMDGIEATRQIRLVEDHYVPIIALTANAQGSVEQACFEAGVDAFLTKPINRAVLQSTLDSVLGLETNQK